MKPQVTVITLGVRNLDTSYNFYAKALGWEPLIYVPDEVAFFQVGYGLVLSLFRGDHLAAEAGNIGHGPLAPPLTLGHNVDSPDEVDAILQTVVNAGAELIAEGTAMSWGGYSGYFADPDGFHWEVCHNPGLVVAEDGSVSLREIV